MRSRFFMILGLTGTLMIGACSSATVEKPSAQANSTAPANSQNSNTVIASNGIPVTPEAAEANAASTSASDQFQSPLDDKRKINNSSGSSLDAAALAMKNARPAPDNSTFTSYLTDAGYEIRTFKNHPQLLKVEKRIENNGSQTLKIFLRGGKIVALPGNAIAILSNASAESIANAAGIASAPVKQAAPGAIPGKKPSN